jgi:hypothetical protein
VFICLRPLLSYDPILLPPPHTVHIRVYSILIHTGKGGDLTRDGGHEQLISNGGRFKLAFAERDKCKPVLLVLSLARNLVKPLLSLYGTEWRERGNGLMEKVRWAMLHKAGRKYQHD